jgi:hypothetical protein
MIDRSIIYPHNCPFCGYDHPIFANDTVDETPPNSLESYFVRCDNCGAKGPAGKDNIEAVKGWNLVWENNDAAIAHLMEARRYWENRCENLENKIHEIIPDGKISTVQKLERLAEENEELHAMIQKTLGVKLVSIADFGSREGDKDE